MKFFIKKVITRLIPVSLRLLFFGRVGFFIQNETIKYILNKTLLVTQANSTNKCNTLV
jgi:hypothetical protein